KATGMHYALKMLKEELVADQEAVRRLHREARTAMNLSHKNLCTIYGAETSTKGVPYLLMELIEGESLATILEQEIFLMPKRAVPIFMQLCDGLSHAHKRHVLHRDLKPGNVIIWNWSQGSNRLRLVDFGIAKSLGPASESATNQLTQTGELIGSPLYMSPEQCRGEQLTAQSDIYSLGCVMYEVLTGKPPFTGSNPVAVIVHHLNDRPERFNRSLLVPPALEAIVLKCLEKSPSERYQSIDALYDDLDAFNQGAAPEVEIKPQKGPTVTLVMPRLSAPFSWTVGIIVSLAVGVIAMTYWLNSSSRSLRAAEEHRFEFYDSKTTAAAVKAIAASQAGQTATNAPNVHLEVNGLTGKRSLKLDLDPDSSSNMGILEELANIHFDSTCDGIFDTIVMIDKEGDRFNLEKSAITTSRFGEIELVGTTSLQFTAADGGIKDCRGIDLRGLPVPLGDFCESAERSSQEDQAPSEHKQSTTLNITSLKFTDHALHVTAVDAQQRSIPVKIIFSAKGLFLPQRIDIEIPDPTANLHRDLWRNLSEELRGKLKAEHSSGQPMDVSIKLPGNEMVAKRAADQEMLNALKRISESADKHG
ncbi:MAG TPA: serine/threonine-protein kinase, partial [Trichormus sp.]